MRKDGMQGQPVLSKPESARGAQRTKFGASLCFFIFAFVLKNLEIPPAKSLRFTDEVRWERDVDLIFLIFYCL